AVEGARECRTAADRQPVVLLARGGSTDLDVQRARRGLLVSAGEGHGAERAAGLHVAIVEERDRADVQRARAGDRAPGLIRKGGAAAAEAQRPTRDRYRAEVLVRRGRLVDRRRLCRARRHDERALVAQLGVE